jgi:hypothetical protein
MGVEVWGGCLLEIAVEGTFYSSVSLMMSHYNVE